LNSADDELITTVKDEGQGIPEDELDGVFNLYQTSSVKATNKEKSTGLGLAIVKKIVESHNGKIGVKSEPGVGSEFYFSLPHK
jgi:signal transduction histidine kinase